MIVSVGVRHAVHRSTVCTHHSRVMRKGITESHEAYEP